MEKPELTYCILHYNKLEKLKKTIKCIEKYTPIPYQVYIWNNGYINNEISRYLRRLEKRPEYIVFYSDINLGCPPARGKLVRMANTRYIFTIDDDIYIQDDTIPIALKLFESDRKIGGVSFPLFDPRGNILSTSGIMLHIRKNILNISKIKFKDGGVVVVDGLPGGAMIFKKDLKKFFTWDPRYKVGFGDIDKTLQIYFSDCPLKQVVSFDSYLIHDQVTYKKHSNYLKVRRNYKELRRSYLYFMRKWKLRLPIIEHFLFKYIYAIPSREITMVLNYCIRKLFKSNF